MRREDLSAQYIRRILAAPVYDVAQETPIDDAPLLSKRLANRVLIKREDLQPVFSFKLRGAYNRLVHLSEVERKLGVVAASAGNHAQGVALSAQRMGIPASIVMPRTAPEIKVASVRSKGARVLLHGDSYDEAYDYALQLAAERGVVLIHPYDDPEVIAGQGTIAMEILRQHPGRLDAIFVPVGGGGLIAGIAVYVKYVRPEIKVIGVEPDDAACLHAALQAGRRVSLQQVGIFVDGVAVRQVGKEPFRIARLCVDEMVLVSADEVCAAIKDIFDDTRSIAEPAGALALAGMKRYVARHGVTGATLLAIDSGANINFDRLRHVSERAELGERREAIFAVTIPERAGSFRAFCHALGKRAITEFNYRYADSRNAQVFVGVHLSRGDQERAELVAALRAKDYPVIDMSDNEMAKLHIRHMVGGHAQQLDDERVFRFEFPERPGALLRFLTHMGERWNISLFHYRSHGAAYARVLVGIQVAPALASEFQGFLDSLGYAYLEETDNPAYRQFLS
jgi:threonine dehydratase